MKPNLDNLREHYKNLSDHKLKELATLEARNLHVEALEVLKKEIVARGLSLELLKGIEVQLNPIDESTFWNYCALIQMQPCPICDRTDKKLNAVMVEKVESIVIASTYEKKLKIGCPDCLKNELESGNIRGIPGGLFSLFKMFSASSSNDSMKGMIKDERPNQILQNFVWRNVGAIEANKANQQGLKEVILAGK